MAAVLLASRDLWNVQARAVGELLDTVGVPNEVVTDMDRLERMRIGAQTRDGTVTAPDAPVVRVRTPEARRPDSAPAALALLAAAAVVVVLLRARRIPVPLKGLVFVVIVVGGLTLAIAAWWDPLPPMDVRFLLVDWRTSVLIPVCIVALLFAYDIYPLPGSFVLKTVWAGLALGVMAAFSTVRLALVAAGYATYGPVAFLPLHQAAGPFWDVLPGIAALAFAHASVAVSAVQSRRRRWLP